MRTLLATLLAFTLLLPAAAEAADPTVTTGPAGPVGATTATLTGTVDPNLTATTWQFEYGTTTAYGLTTPVQSAGLGDDPVAVQATVSGLTANTTYHFRLTANGIAGADGTFRTTANPANPAVPSISTLRVADRTATSARLTANVDPNRAATTFHMEWGTTTRYGNRTPDQTLPAGDGAVPVSAPLAGLAANTRIYWRVVATNAAGTRRSGRASFTTLRDPTGVTLSVFPTVALWNTTVSLSGRVEGAGVNGLAVALQETPFPYTAAPVQVATARANASGVFRFPSRPLTISSQFRAVTLGAASAASGLVGAQVRVRAGIRRTQQRRRTLRLAGGVQPGLPDGAATLQRRTRRGGWAYVKRKPLEQVDANLSRYRFRVVRQSRSRVYRVKVWARDGGAHLGTVTTARRVGKRR